MMSLLRIGHMDTDRIRLAKQLFQSYQFHAVRFHYLFLRERIVCQNPAFKTAEQSCQTLSDTAVTDNAYRAADDLISDILYPFSGFCPRLICIDPSAGREHHGKRHLRHSRCICSGGPGYGNAVCTCRLKVYFIISHTKTHQ